MSDVGSIAVERSIDQFELGQREWQLAYAVGLRVLRAPDQAEDIAQETMLRAHLVRHKYDGRAGLPAWLRRIALNAAISQLRRENRAGWSDSIGTDALPEWSPSPEEGAACREALEVLQGCLRAMNARNRTALIAVDVLGASMRELGGLLGASPNAAKQRVFRARHAVRAHLCEPDQPAASVRVAEVEAVQ